MKARPQWGEILMQQFRKALAIWNLPQSWVLLDQLAGALLGHNGPALVEFPVPRQELSMPPTITLEQAKGFSVFMMKAVLSGRSDEIIDLASVNLFR